MCDALLSRRACELSAPQACVAGSPTLCAASVPMTSPFRVGDWERAASLGFALDERDNALAQPGTSGGVVTSLRTGLHQKTGVRLSSPCYVEGVVVLFSKGGHTGITTEIRGPGLSLQTRKGPFGPQRAPSGPKGPLRARRALVFAAKPQTGFCAALGCNQKYS